MWIRADRHLDTCLLPAARHRRAVEIKRRRVAGGAGLPVPDVGLLPEIRVLHRFAVRRAIHLHDLPGAKGTNRFGRRARPVANCDRARSRTTRRPDREGTRCRTGNGCWRHGSNSGRNRARYACCKRRRGRRCGRTGVRRASAAEGDESADTRDESDNRCDDERSPSRCWCGRPMAITCTALRPLVRVRAQLLAVDRECGDRAGDRRHLVGKRRPAPPGQGHQPMDCHVPAPRTRCRWSGSAWVRLRSVASS
jgi:hypothetical protein